MKGQQTNSTLHDLTQEEVFDRMAPGWYSRRHWTIFKPELEELASRWRRGSILNIGCGHGADFLPFNGFALYGVDISRAMLRFGLKYSDKFGLGARLVQGDATALPFVAESFDWAISVATYHHLPTRESRRLAFGELYRVLKPEGEAFVTVWNRWQPSFWLKHKETYVRWRTRDRDLRRYYYLFSRHEIEELAGEAGFVVLKSYAESSYQFPLKAFSRNICLLLRRS